MFHFRKHQEKVKKTPFLNKERRTGKKSNNKTQKQDRNVLPAFFAFFCWWRGRGKDLNCQTSCIRQKRQSEIILKKPGQTLRFFKFSVSLAPFTYIEKLVANWLWMRTFLWKDWAMLFLTSSTSSDWKRKERVTKKNQQQLKRKQIGFLYHFSAVMFLNSCDFSAP